MQSKNKTAVRSMEILNLFFTHSMLSLNEIANISGIPKTSVYRMVMSLEEMGLLDKGRDGKYSLGLLFLQFGHLVAERLDIRQVALPIMQKLHDKVGEAVNPSYKMAKRPSISKDWIQNSVLGLIRQLAGELRFMPERVLVSFSLFSRSMSANNI